jgi:hypothetical protein
VSASDQWPNESIEDTNGNLLRHKTNNGTIMAVCSNWDLACHEPPNFFTGVKTNVIDSMPFVHFRANNWHKKLVSKADINYDQISSSDFYFFEIEWLPTRIIWRIGPERDEMQVLCIMDDSMTTIPNNQMLPVVGQEWHSTESWYLSPFEQNFIPFPKDDVIGQVMEIWVE